MGSGASKKKSVNSGVSIKNDTDIKNFNLNSHAHSVKNIKDTDPNSASKEKPKSESQIDHQKVLKNVSNHGKPDTNNYHKGNKNNDIALRKRINESTESLKEWKLQNDRTYTEKIFNENDLKFYKFLTFETVDSDDEEGNLKNKVIEGLQEKKNQYQPNFTVFPSHTTLREENRKYAEFKKEHKYQDEDSDKPQPTILQKCEVFDKAKFKHIDEYAFHAPSTLLSSRIESVVEYLVKPCKSNLDKVRIVFAWCCFQNVAELPKGVEMGDGSIGERLQGIHQKTTSYTKLFHDMCKCTRLQCKTIDGWSKDADYDISDKAINRKVSWTAVKIDSEWRFIDLASAAKKLYGVNNKKWALIDDNGKGYTKLKEEKVIAKSDMDESYFLTDPEEFIYDHFPCEEKWQLLARPVTLNEFMDMADIQSSFFHYGLAVREAKQCKIEASAADATIKLGVPKDKPRRFMYRLWKSETDKNVNDLKVTSELQQCVYLEQKPGILICKVFFPLPGMYKLELFAKDTSDGQFERMYSSCVNYLLLCNNENLTFSAIPNNSRHEWGPGQDVKDAGIRTVTHPMGMIETNDGTSTIMLKLDRDVHVMPKLRGLGGTDTSQWLIYRVKENIVTIDIRIQEKGKYALDIYVKQKNEENYMKVCAYLICAANGVFDSLKFPPIANQEVGPTKWNEKYCLHPVVNSDAYLKSEDGKQNIEFQFKDSLQFFAKIAVQTQDGYMVLEDAQYTWIDQNQTGRVAFKIRFPYQGIYMLEVCAKFKDSEGTTYNTIYNYCMYVKKPMEDFLPFPKRYSAWSEGCKVKGLENAFIACEKPIKVRARIPNAVAVAVIKCLLKNKSFTQLQKVGDDWEGELNSGESGTTIKLSACFNEETGQYSNLTVHEVKSEQEINEYKAKMKIANAPIEKQLKKESERNQKQLDEFDKLQQGLREALTKQEMQLLRREVKVVEDRHCITRMKNDYDKAKNLINNLHKINRLNEIIVKLDDKSMKEIIQDEVPDKPIHDVLIAALLLLGISDEKIEDWSYCQEMCEIKKFKKLVMNVVVAELTPITIAKTLQLLQSYRVDELAEMSLAAAYIYTWTVGIARISLQFDRSK